MPRFEWDEKKSRSNKAKHGLSFNLACKVFDDPHALSQIDERFDYGEERWVTMGRVPGAVVLVVAHTVREKESDHAIRIISARKATRRERQIYEEGI